MKFFALILVICMAVIGVILAVLNAVEVPPGCARTPLEVAIVLDTSGSMSRPNLPFTKIRETKMELAASATANLLTTLRDRGGILTPTAPNNPHRVALVTFSGETASLRLGLGAGQPEDILNMVRASHGAGYTSLNRAVTTTVAALAESRPGTRKVVVILSDGMSEPEADRLTAENIRQLHNSVDYVYAVTLGRDSVDLNAMRSLAKPDSRFFRLFSSASVAPIFATVAAGATCPPPPDPPPVPMPSPILPPRTPTPTPTPTPAPAPTVTTPTVQPATTLLNRYFGRPGAAPGAGGGGILITVLMVSGIALIGAGVLTLRSSKRRSKTEDDG